MLWGSEKARIDDKHRLCLSAKLRKKLLGEYESTDVFITSLDGKEVKVFPKVEWLKMAERLSERSTAGSDLDGKRKNKILFLANHFGQQGSLDNQGRVLIPGTLREVPGIEGDVWTVWQSTHMVVMSDEHYQRKTVESQLSDADLAYAENLGL